MNTQRDHTPSPHWMNPPDEIRTLIDVTPTPALSMSKDKKWLLLLQRAQYPPIAILSQPELKLAGLRFNPSTYSNHRLPGYIGLSLKDLKTLEELPIEGLPQHPNINNVSFSHDSSKLAFTQCDPDGLSLWMVDVNSRQAQKIPLPTAISDVIGSPYSWIYGTNKILVKSVKKITDTPPVSESTPSGPVIMESSNENKPARTYQDLLRNPHDEALFEYYTTCELITWDYVEERCSHLDISGIITQVSISPDGNYMLVFSLHKPFSYTVPCDRFPIKVDLYTRDGKFIRTISDLPLAENIPIAFGSVREGARSIHWRSDSAAKIYWTCALDKGNPTIESEYRDEIFSLESPFDETIQPKSVFKTRLRFSNIEWANDQLAIYSEWWWPTRKAVIYKWSPSDPNAQEVLFDYSFEDSYNDPGNVETNSNAYGRSVITTNASQDCIYLCGLGASDEGNRPFLDELNINSKVKKRLWQSEAPYYELPSGILDVDQHLLITRRESNTERPNYFIRNWETHALRAITHFPDLYPSLNGIKKELIRYKRADGIDLTGILYLPKDFKPHSDPPLPVLMWAYPREYKSAQAASQVTDSPFSYPIVHWASPMMWVNRGYAIFDDFGVPIVSEGDAEPNESFVSQLQLNAKAAVDTLVTMGVADPKKIAVGGHSYGAFMTANLLIHTDLFAAGIARSGAYNRTLTPFGFQSEDRTLWEASDTYLKMSPFLYANKINAPLLMIHGDADNNMGTHTMQSERFFAALRGNGMPARLVLLPLESHAYLAKESIFHTLWEMDNWLENHVKNNKQ
ncbi:MAG: S9 family peptidase [Saprospiraceae bacterium]|nr:S9 family peptidase [Saprospiraceae bacterium]